MNQHYYKGATLCCHNCILTEVTNMVPDNDWSLFWWIYWYLRPGIDPTSGL